MPLLSYSYSSHIMLRHACILLIPRPPVQPYFYVPINHMVLQWYSQYHDGIGHGKVLSIANYTKNSISLAHTYRSYLRNLKISPINSAAV